MAQRRMFSKKIIETDVFMDMPLSSQALYFHLNIYADDDGFVGNPKKVQRIIGANDDDMKILFAKEFIFGFESGVIVIKHWKIHNYIPTDRYAETLYIAEKSTLSEDANKMYTKCIQNVDSGKVSIELGKVSKRYITLKKPKHQKPLEESKEMIDYNSIKKQFNSICKKLPSVKLITEKRKKDLSLALKNLKEIDDTYDFETYFKIVAESPFLNGDNREGWRADFDWILKINNMLKIIEGRYTNKKVVKSTAFNNFKSNVDVEEIIKYKNNQVEG